MVECAAAVPDEAVTVIIYVPAGVPVPGVPEGGGEEAVELLPPQAAKTRARITAETAAG